jgi:hypothetical protein
MMESNLGKDRYINDRHFAQEPMARAFTSFVVPKGSILQGSCLQA